MPATSDVSPSPDSSDLVSAIRQDHEEIRSLISGVELPSDAATRQESFDHLVRKLAVHETAEEEVVRPAVRQAGGDDIADRRNDEEASAKRTLSDLERLGVESPEFASTFQTLKAEVLAHAEREEQEEHPLLLQGQSQERLETLAGAFRAAEAAAPTHPHPHGPESAVGNVAVGPAVALVDRARDAVRKALQKVRG